MLSKGLLNYSFYKLFKNFYNNYLSLKYKENYKSFKQNKPFIYNVQKIKYDYEYRK